MGGDENDDVDDGEEANRVRRGMTGWRNGVMIGKEGSKEAQWYSPHGVGQGRGGAKLAALQQGVVMDNHGSCGSSNQWKVNGARYSEDQTGTTEQQGQEWLKAGQGWNA